MRRDSDDGFKATAAVVAAGLVTVLVGVAGLAALLWVLEQL